jgi:hypothetical protein
MTDRLRRPRQVADVEVVTAVRAPQEVLGLVGDLVVDAVADDLAHRRRGPPGGQACTTCRTKMADRHSPFS